MYQIFFNNSKYALGYVVRHNILSQGDDGMLYLGAYLLTVLWSGQHVSGSPFKVSVMSSSDASKVVCTGDGLSSIVLGRDGSALIDTRSAGPGR